MIIGPLELVCLQGNDSERKFKLFNVYWDLGVICPSGSKRKGVKSHFGHFHSLISFILCEKGNTEQNFISNGGIN